MAEGYTISKTFTFAASHRLDGLPVGHKCARLHGHNYEVTLQLMVVSTDAVGFVLDYAALKPFRDYLTDTLDHRHLGVRDVYGPDGKVEDRAVLTFNPTAENLAAHLLDVAVELFDTKDVMVSAVEVKETDATNAVAYR